LGVWRIRFAIPVWHDLTMTISKGKSPRDPNPLTAETIAVSTDLVPVQEREAPITNTTPATISEYLASIGRKGGQIGGKRRLKTMTKEQRRKIATKAAKARWKK
jgi:hypothetical protein